MLVKMTSQGSEADDKVSYIVSILDIVLARKHFTSEQDLTKTWKTFVTESQIQYIFGFVFLPCMCTTCIMFKNF